MASKAKKSRRMTPGRFHPVLFLRRWALRLLVASGALIVLGVVLFAFVDPPATAYMRQEKARVGGIDHHWVQIEDIAPVMGRSVVAAEDANFCQHWGFDVVAIRAALAEGTGRGASTISQQVVKNVYLWHGRNWWRKALEATITPMVEAIWSKRRILEVYLNVAEFDKGVFGVGAAAQHYFGVEASKLTTQNAARLAAVLPDPKGRSAKKPGAELRARADRIMDGAATIAKDGRADCFE